MESLSDNILWDYVRRIRNFLLKASDILLEKYLIRGDAFFFKSLLACKMVSESVTLKSSDEKLIPVSMQFCREFKVLKNILEDLGNTEEPIPLLKIDTKTIDHLQGLLRTANNREHGLPLLFGATDRSTPLNLGDKLNLIKVTLMLFNEVCFKKHILGH